MNRSELKAIVKECLVEILSEGLNNNVRMHENACRPQKQEQREANGTRNTIKGKAHEQHANHRRNIPFDPKLDTPIKNANARVTNPTLNEAIKRESQGNSVLANILADTAATTLQTMLANGDSGNADGSSGASRNSSVVQQEQFNGNPEELFPGAVARNDGSTHWADLAFSQIDKK